MIPDLVGLKAKAITGAVVLAVVLTVFGVQEYRISSLKSEITEKDDQISKLTGDLAVANANVTVLKTSVERQNLAVEALKQEKASLDAKVRSSALAAQKKRVSSVSIDGSGVENMNKFFEKVFK